MRVEVIGSPAILDGDRVVRGVQLGGRRVHLALGALALAGRVVPTEQLADIVWSGDPPATWRVALRGLVNQLRTAAATVSSDPLIATSPGGYRLADGVQVDLDDARSALERAGALLAAGRPAAALEIAEPLCGLGPDDLLPGEEGEWLRAPRSELERLSLRAAEVVVDGAAQVGRPHTGLAVAHAAVAAAPLDERAHRLLLVALDRAGDRAGVVRAFEQCRQLLADQLGVDPSPETVARYLEALQEAPTQSQGRLPQTPTSFVGRGTEVARLHELLAAPGLVSVVGRGGIGKSRLAAHVVTGAGGLPGGRWWVSLSAVAQDALVAATVAVELGVTPAAGEAATAIVRQLAPLGRAVLVLDGCEQVVDGVASLMPALLAGAPLLTVVTTTRLPLGVDGERVFELGPLPVVDPARLEGSDQLRLLLDRAGPSAAALARDHALRAELTALLRRCAGVPLAVELVAAQLAGLAPGDLLDHLDDVTGGSDDLLRSVTRAGYELLDPDAAAVFRRFGALDGPVSITFAQEVLGGDALPGVRVVRVLRELTDRGLLLVDRSGPRWRYQQDDDVHRFARELLREHGEEAEAYRRLAAAVRAMLPADARSAPAEYRDRVTEVLAAIRGLFGAAVGGVADRERCLELAFRLHRYFAATNVAEGQFWLTRLRAGAADTQERVYATWALGYLNYWLGDTDNAMRELREVVEALDGQQDPYYARALIYLAGLLDDIDRGTEAVEYVRRSIDAAAPFGTDLRVAAAMGLGSVLAERGDPAAAGHAADAVALCADSPEQLAIALPTAAMVCWQVGAIEAAEVFAARARPLHASGKRIARVVLLSAAAGIELARGDAAAALEYATVAEAEATELGVEREVPLIRCLLSRTHLALGDRAAAVAAARRGLDSAETVAIGYPLAHSLESVVLVADASPADVRADLLATAADLRRRGDRPVPPSLAAAVEQAARELGPGTVLERVTAIETARRVLPA